MMKLTIGMSLSEPHTSMIVLQTCVCMFACLWTSTYRSNIQVHLSSVKKDSEGLLPGSSVGVKESQSKDDLVLFPGPTQLPVVCFDFHFRVTGKKLKMTHV